MLQVFGIWRTLKGWKTILASVGVATAGVLQTTDWATIVGPQATGPALLAIGIGSAILRFLTDTPVGRKARKSPGSGADRPG
jgi:hypothetical protein